MRSQILADAFGRVRELVIDLTDGLTDEMAIYRPDPEANSIAWLLWRLTRGQDHQVANLAQVEQVWPQWRQRFRLPSDKWATGYGQGPEEVAAVRVSGDLLEGLSSPRGKGISRMQLSHTQAAMSACSTSRTWCRRRGWFRCFSWPGRRVCTGWPMSI